MEQTKRWANLTYWNLPTVQDLHRRELKAHKKQTEQAAARQRITVSWEMIFPDFSQSVAGQFQLIPFWPDSVPREEHGPRMDRFKALIYPVWGKIFDTWKRNPTEPEITMLHKCDIAILESGIKVDRLYLGEVTAMRQKAAKAQKYGRQYTEAMSD